MGWLVDEIEADEADRVAQLNALRSLIIPKVAFLLHLIMHSMADYAGCVALGDLIAARQDSLHKVTKHNMTVNQFVLWTVDLASFLPIIGLFP